jgi:Uma2 family endonuclease
MPRPKPHVLTAADYAEAAQDYLRRLTQEHFMEATSQATQREITVESLALVKAQRPDVHYFNELLVQYSRPGRSRLGQVVPDNMVVLSDQPIDANGSYDLPQQPTPPFWVLEYVSKHNRRKDYEENFEKYEKALKVPYYLLFYPETRDLTLYRHTNRKYVAVSPNEQERLPIPELELEVGLRDGWVRFWFRGKLLPLPADLQRDLDEARRQSKQLQQMLDQERQAREAAEHELEQLRAQLRQTRKRPRKGP